VDRERLAEVIGTSLDEDGGTRQARSSIATLSVVQTLEQLVLLAAFFLLRNRLQGLEGANEAASLRSWGWRRKVTATRQRSAEGGWRHPPSDQLCGYPVVALQVSVLPNCAGQSRSGQGAGSASSPAASEAAR
jgi:hypothetical protein